MGDGWGVTEIMYQGINDGPYFGIPTTGRTFNVRGVTLYRFDENGLVTNFETYRDEVTLLTQMGVIPSQPIGIFDYHMDIGVNVPAGYGAYDSSSDTYELVSGGIGYTRDHYTLYNEVNGDFSLTARIQAEDQGGSATDWATAGLIAMDDPGSDPEELKIPYFTSWYTINDEVSARWKRGLTFGANAYAPSLIIPAEDGLLERIVREGNTITMYYADPTSGDWVQFISETVELTDPVYAGLWAASFVKGAYTKGTFTEVELITEQGTSGISSWELF